MADFVARFNVVQVEPPTQENVVMQVTAFRTRVGDMNSSRWSYLFDLGGGVELGNEPGTLRLIDRKNGRVFLMNNSLENNDWRRT